MSGRTILVGVLAMVCGMSAAFGVNQFRGQAVIPDVAPVNVTKIPVAAVNIVRGEEISEAMIIDRDWPTDFVPAGTVLKKEELIGKIAESTLYPNEPFLAEKVGDTERFSGMVKEGMRAYTILTPNDASLVAGLIEPGDKVDVLFTDQQSERTFTGGGSTTPLLQNIEVLAVGRALDAKESRSQEVKNMRSVTLSVTLDMTTKLALAQTVGTLHLALRSELDESTAKASAITLNELMRTMYPALAEQDEELQPVEVTPLDAAAAAEPMLRHEIVVRTLRGFVPSETVMAVSKDGLQRLHLSDMESSD